MCLVPQGEFIMGSNERNNDEEPVHTVFLDAFYIDKFEITNAQYKICVDAGVCQLPKDFSSNTHSSYFDNPEFDHYPVINVDWNMAKTYCEWRGARLPTEAEWEKAARGSDARTYPWGEVLDCEHANYGQNNSGACVGDTTPAGSYEIGQSIYGLHDMAGNVNEWVSSLYQSYPYSMEDGREDLEASGVRVFRGGSWSFITGDIRSANRNGYGATIFNDNIGFRCAKNP
jgi:formylglycine-generating enzyme required for sulfatase activity